MSSAMYTSLSLSIHSTFHTYIMALNQLINFYKICQKQRDLKRLLTFQMEWFSTADRLWKTTLFLSPLRKKEENSVVIHPPSQQLVDQYVVRYTGQLGSY